MKHEEIYQTLLDELRSGKFAAQTRFPSDAQLAALGKRVPDDIRIAGFDDVNFATLCSPALTTAHQPCDELAELAFELLQARQRNPAAPPREAFLSAPLVVRGSVHGSK